MLWVLEDQLFHFLTKVSEGELPITDKNDKVYDYT